MTQETITINEENNCELEKDLTYEVSKEVKMVMKFNYKKEDLIGFLIEEVNKLKKQVEWLEDKKNIITQDDLVDLWDNEQDDRWNKY